MSQIRNRTLDRISGKMEGIEQDSLRYHILESAKNFKTSWIELGQSLYSAWKDKLYKEWGYMTFDAYTLKEIGIKKQTALKLLRSYYFLEKEEPAYLKKDYAETQEISSVPSYESVNALRLAKSKKSLDAEDYSRLKAGVLEMGKDATEVKKELTQLIRQREDLEPEEARRKKKVAVVRRFIATLRSLRRDIEISKLVTASVIKELSSLINKIESEVAE